MVHRLRRGAFAFLVLLAAAASALFARHSLSEISRPHDPFRLSVIASGLLSALFLAALVGCLLPAREYSVTNHIARWLWTILVAGLFIGASLLIIASETPTSLVSWDQQRGASLPWLANGRFFGPRIALDRPCRTYWLSSLNPLVFLLDLGVILAAVHFVRRLAALRDAP